MAVLHGHAGPTLRFLARAVNSTIAGGGRTHPFATYPAAGWYALASYFVLVLVALYSPSTGRRRGQQVPLAITPRVVTSFSKK